MADEVLSMSILYINKHRSKLKDLYFKNRHKTIYLTLPTSRRKKEHWLKILQHENDKTCPPHIKHIWFLPTHIYQPKKPKELNFPTQG